MTVENKLLIDKHFTDNYKYYQTISKRYFKGHLAEDFTHELYIEFLKCPNETIQKFNGKLKLLSLFICRALVVKSTRTKRSKKGQTHPLYDCGDRMLDITLLDLPQEEIELFEIDEAKVEIIKESVWTSVERVRKDGVRAPNKYYEIATFAASQNESIRSIARRTGLSRNQVSDISQLGAIKLKRLIQ